MESSGEFALAPVPTEQSATPAGDATMSQQGENNPDTVSNPQGEGQSASEFQFELASGVKYRTIDDLVHGATEKDFTIQRMKAQLAELQAQGHAQPQAPQIDPQVQINESLERYQREWEQELRGDPMFQNAGPEAIAAEARIQARVSLRNEQQLQRQLQQQLQTQTQQAEFRSFTEANRADLYSDVGARVYEEAKASGRPFATPQDHLNAVHAEMFRLSRSGQQPQPQAGGTTGVQGALQTQQRSMFGYANGTGLQQQGGQLSEGVQRAIQLAMDKGFTSPEALERVKQNAIQNEAKYRR